jgi:NTP pyrophosphatase (non-canonical NTP hydrolase)
MSLMKNQKDVDDWVQQYKIPYWKPHEIMARLMEEVGELAREINFVYGPKKKKSNEEKRDIADEMGDIIFTVCCLANSQKINLDSSWKRIMDKCYKRDKNRFTKKG